MMVGLIKVVCHSLPASALLSMLLVTACTPVAPQSNVAREPLARASWRGVDLTLQLAGRTFPARALIRAAVTIHNGSGTIVLAQPICTDGTVVETWAETVTRKGSVSPQLLSPPGLPVRALCPGTIILHPGQTVTQRNLLVLRTDRVQARAAISTLKPSRLLADRQTDLTTPAIHLTLRHDLPAPRDVVRVAGGLRATIVPPPSVHGPLLYVQWFHCMPSDLLEGLENPTWTSTRSMTLTPDLRNTKGCSRITEWNVVAGWLDHPVSEILYFSPHGRHAY